MAGHHKHSADDQWNANYEYNVRRRAAKERTERNAMFKRLDAEYASKFPNYHHKYIKEKD